jgi:hypothetical protein
LIRLGFNGMTVCLRVHHDSLWMKIGLSCWITGVHVIKSERAVERGVCNRNIDLMSSTLISLLIPFHNNKTSLSVMSNRGSILGRSRGSS